MRSFPPIVDAYTPHATWEPNVGSRVGYLRSVLGQSRGALTSMVFATTLWYASAAVTPYLIGEVVDKISAGQLSTLGWAPWLLLLATLAFIVGGTYITVADTRLLFEVSHRQRLLIGHKVSQLGPKVPQVVTTGEVVSLAEADARSLARFANTVGRLPGALISLTFIVAMMFTIDIPLALIVLVATPLIVIGVIPFMKPVEKAAQVERDRASTLTTTATDIVAGLRILRGIGGERAFADNYRRRSMAARTAAVRRNWFDEIANGWWTFANGALMVVLAWVGMSKVLQGQMSAGHLVTFFGFATVLQFALGSFVDLVGAAVPAWVSAGKSIDFLQHRPDVREDGSASMPSQGLLRDDASGVEAAPGVTLLVSATPDDAAQLADRLGAVGEADGVSFGGVPLAQIATDEVRRRIVVSQSGAEVLAGTLQDVVDPLGKSTREQAEQALLAACADDVFSLLPNGWASAIDERGRGLSGGQRQRLVLARALLADPDVLILVEPTSAVDAHTEARIASRVKELRKGKPTVVVSSSPLWAHAADHVAFLAEPGRWVRGTHTELATDPVYRRVVLRTEENDDV